MNSVGRLEMELLWGRTGDRRSRGLVQLLFIALAMFQLCVAQPVIFSYGLPKIAFAIPNDPNAYVTALQTNDITCLGNISSRSDKYSQIFGLSLPVSLGSQEGINLTGRALYRNPIQFMQPCGCSQPTAKSFSTMFDFQTGFYNYYVSSLTSGKFQGMIAFIITGDNSAQGDSGHNFSVELDFVLDMQLQAPVEVHVGVHTNSLTSVNTSTVEASQSAGFELLIWIEYNGSSRILDIFVNVDGSLYKPRTPTIRTMEVDLGELLSNRNMFVGFSESITNVTVPTVKSVLGVGTLGLFIQQWSFNSDGLAPDYPRNPDGTLKNTPDEAFKRRIRKIITVVAITVPCALLFMILTIIIWILYRRNARLTALAKKYEIEEDLLDRGPQNFKYKVLSTATKGFSSHELLGRGGFGSVYRGRLWLQGAATATDVAVKRISADSHQGAREFLAEVKIIGQVQHRNLVRLLGWCHEKGELLLVYDYMPNGSVDQHLFKNTDGPGGPLLTWSRRLKIVSGVATALAYLHEEWEQRVIHRDVKSSNVMLDRDFNARLGDFGLARLSEHDQAPPSTVALAGTYGYLAPEMARTLRATEKTDVYSFGAFVLEVATGRRPILSVEDRTKCNELLLVDWVWGLYRQDTLLEAADCGLQNAFDPGEMIVFLKIGLLCSHPDPDERPTMREVLNIWKCSSPFPPLPRTKPVPVFTRSIEVVTISADNSGHSDDNEQRAFALESDANGTFITTSTGSPISSLRYRPSSTATPLPW